MAYRLVHYDVDIAQSFCEHIRDVSQSALAAKYEPRLSKQQVVYLKIIIRENVLVKLMDESYLPTLGSSRL